MPFPAVVLSEVGTLSMSLNDFLCAGSNTRQHKLAWMKACAVVAVCGPMAGHHLLVVSLWVCFFADLDLLSALEGGVTSRV